MTPFRILVGGLMLAAVVLAALNPGPAAFDEFLAKRIATETAEAAGTAAAGALSGGVTDFLADRIGEAAAEALDQEFQRDNYYVWSVYRADLNAWRPGGEVEFLGVAGKFFPLTMPKALQDL